MWLPSCLCVGRAAVRGMIRAAASGSLLLAHRAAAPLPLTPHERPPSSHHPPRQVCTRGRGGGVPVRHGVPVPLLLLRPGARLERAAVQGL